MFYSDEETRDNEVKFQTELLKVYKFHEEDQEKTGALLLALSTEGYEIMKNTQPTPEQLERLDEIWNEMMSISNLLNKHIPILAESLSRQMSSIYLEIKEKAEDGDSNAMKVYLDIKSEYESLVLSGISNN